MGLPNRGYTVTGPYQPLWFGPVVQNIRQSEDCIIQSSDCYSGWPDQTREAGIVLWLHDIVFLFFASCKHFLVGNTHRTDVPLGVLLNVTVWHLMRSWFGYVTVWHVILYLHLPTKNSTVSISLWLTCLTHMSTGDFISLRLTLITISINTFSTICA